VTNKELSSEDEAQVEAAVQSAPHFERRFVRKSMNSYLRRYAGGHYQIKVGGIRSVTYLALSNRYLLFCWFFAVAGIVVSLVPATPSTPVLRVVEFALYAIGGALLGLTCFHIWGAIRSRSRFRAEERTAQMAKPDLSSVQLPPRMIKIPGRFKRSVRVLLPQLVGIALVFIVLGHDAASFSVALVFVLVFYCLYGLISVVGTLVERIATRDFLSRFSMGEVFEGSATFRPLKKEEKIAVTGRIVLDHTGVVFRPGRKHIDREALILRWDEVERMNVEPIPWRLETGELSITTKCGDTFAFRLQNYRCLGRVLREHQ